MKDTWESKRKAYLEEIRTKQQSFDKSHQKELDKLDEKYAKLTRDSIYANLVGTDTWKYH
jgi:Skp family chaperone for outer membrane proteins